MTIETAIFAIQRGGQQFSCKGSELRDKLTDGDILAVTRGGVGYHFVLEAQGRLKLISDVDFEFNDAGAIVITQDAQAKGGDTPYSLATEYDIALGNGILSKNLPDRAATSAAVVNGTPYISFGRTQKDPSDEAQEVYSFDIESSEFIERYDNTVLGEKMNNRYGVKRLKFQGKDIIIDVYNEQATNENNKLQFVYFGLDQDKAGSIFTADRYNHLHPGQDSNYACAGVLSDKNGDIYTIYHEGDIYKHTNIKADSLGYPDFLDTDIISTPLGTPSTTSWMKGAQYHEGTHCIYYSSQRSVIKINLDTNRVSELTRLVPNDAGQTASFAFTSKYAIRTNITPEGLIENTYYGELGRSSVWTKIGDNLYINDPDNKYLFEISPGAPIRMLDYAYTGDPFGSSAPWEEFRPESMPTGDIGGVGTIILEPFNLMWYQDSQLKSWGSIPDRTQAVTVIQSITDANGDSVSSSTTKAPL